MWESCGRLDKLEGMEEVLPPQTQHGAGFELTRVRQFTVFLENRVGRLQTLMLALEEVGHIAAIAIEESADSALVRVICADPDLGRDALRTAGFGFSESELLAVELPTKTRNPLVAICAALLAAEINIHYMYPLLSRPRGPAVVLYVDDPTLSAQLLIRKGFTLISENDLRM
ncbi:MAG: hypothetical protein JWO87_22 [Phycisphaerales bacterium]|jgi:hypothetical protein|nr:hypothetical protein [Phycisphaerales bacterium]MDB5298359.1 hypothetical protein [Phycisphaerales bacterium]MDB5305305.1 hypothetical protein [Phycisphaerales bacterium]